MREKATADRCVQAKRLWEKQHKEAARHRQQQQAHQRTEKPQSVSLELARARTRVVEAEAGLLR